LIPAHSHRYMTLDSPVPHQNELALCFTGVSTGVIETKHMNGNVFIYNNSNQHLNIISGSKLGQFHWIKPESMTTTPLTLKKSPVHL